jgi:hypothetical protein
MSELAEVERRRVRALVDADLETLDELLASEFQLVTPGGTAYTKEEYVARVASGASDYRRWEPDEIRERLVGSAGAVRYRARIAVSLDGGVVQEATFWHTEFYERRDERWQCVWSHGTRIAP